MPAPPDVQAGRQLRALRVLLGFKQQELADRAKVSRTSVVKLEQGRFVYACTRAAVEQALGIAATSSQPERGAP